MNKDLRELQDSLGKVISQIKNDLPKVNDPSYNQNRLFDLSPKLNDLPKISSFPEIITKNNKELVDKFNSVYEEIKKINDNANQAETVNKDRYEKSIELSDKSLKIARYSLFASIILGISSILTPIIQTYLLPKPNSEQTVPLTQYNVVLQRIQTMEHQLNLYKTTYKEKSKKLNKS